MPSDDDLLRRGDVLRVFHTHGASDAEECGESCIRAIGSALCALPADPIATAALRLAEALDERDALVAADPLDAIEDRGGWAARIAGLLMAYRDAKEATDDVK